MGAMPRRGTSEGVRRGFGTVLACGLALAIAGCGSASDPSPPAGVDMLVIPTPSPDPEDFVAEIDNPWLPYEPGAEWVYELSGTETGTVTVTVAEETAPVAGITATVVRSLQELDDRQAAVTDYYAQDRAGNVWWLGREGQWEAGVDGAQAGLAMAANPREGDGYRLALLDGVVMDRARVVAVDGEVSVAAGDFTDVVEIETQSPLVPGVRLRQSHAEGVGLVQVVSLEGPLLLQELVSGP
jgi:hypothetical protein